MKMGTNSKGQVSAKTSFFIFVSAWMISAPVVFAQQVQVATGFQMVSIHILMKHGARAPLGKCVTDPNPPTVWEQGYGKLTNYGVRCQYYLGQFLRTQYSSFLTFNSMEILVNSTNSDRCIQSAQTTLVSFFAPESKNEIVPGLPFQPISTHCRETKFDKFLHVDFENPRLIVEWDKQFYSSEFTAEFEKHKAFTDELHKQSGYEISWFTVLMFHDTMFYLKLHNMTVPDWVEPYWDEVTQLSDYIYSMLFKPPEVLKIIAGPLILDMIETMELTLTGNNQTEVQLPKVRLFSVQDIHVTGILFALDIYESRPPPSATLILELHNGTSTGSGAVRLLYLNSTTPDNVQTIQPVTLRLKGYGEYCPLDKFKEVVVNVIPQNFDRDCLDDCRPCQTLKYNN